MIEAYKDTFGTWYEKFVPILMDPEFEKLGNTIAKLRKVTKVYPDRKDVFRCFKETNLKNLSVIIWSEQPYYDKISDGLAFSSNEPMIEPVELSKFKKAIEDQLYFGLNLNAENDLSYLSKQGVLLYNSNLTVSSIHHVQMWKWFNNEFVDLINNLDWPIHIISMGDLAHSYTNHLVHSVHQIEHPSEPNWDSENCFNVANEFLKKNYGPLTTIKW